MKVPPHDASVLEMNDWIAGLRDDGRAGPAGEDRHARPAPQAGADVPHPGRRAGAGGSDRAGPAERAAIGDQLRIPIAWCEMGSCISHHADPAALGEADIRARAISAGWRRDGLGRLACPQCQQNASGFWASHPVALWDRNVAITRAYLMTAAMRNDAAARKDPPPAGARTSPG